MIQEKKDDTYIRGEHWKAVWKAMGNENSKELHSLLDKVGIMEWLLIEFHALNMASEINRRTMTFIEAVLVSEVSDKSTPE